MEFEEAKPEYLEKLETIRNGEFIQVPDFSARYGLNEGDE